MSEGRLRRPRSVRTGGIGAAISMILFVTAVAREPIVEVEGRQVSGYRIILIQDTSGSVAEHHQATAMERLSALDKAGIVSEVVCRLSNDEFPDFSNCIHSIERLAENKDIDGVYVLSDFHWAWNGSDYTCSAQQSSGTRHIVETFERTGWRLYLETMQCQVPGDLARLAEDSGGAVLYTNTK
ncbi:MAG: hypothetical protein JNL62_14450 [Bryobacterales bacterium]|nr:hypothetical protein [Bryobacterales bacterium]